jgi:hypothetical protein
MCTSNEQCPGRQICCGPDTDKPGKCEGLGAKACFNTP